MPKLEEKRWEYRIDLVFNRQKIDWITITDHYQEKHLEITNELIIALVVTLNEVRLEGVDYKGRKVFQTRVKQGEKVYRIIFWFKDNETNHLWIRNCYPNY